MVENNFPCEKSSHNFWEQSFLEPKSENAYNMGKYDCELYKDRYVIVPVFGKEGHCTAIFDIDNNKWMNMDSSSCWNNNHPREGKQST